MSVLIRSFALLMTLAIIGACTPMPSQPPAATEENLDQDLDGDGIIDGEQIVFES
ncbi:hypothetical protein RM543_03555 [Roseicyclus sp. F158]|uniref:EF-hand domain-containing protein n=1 Tax=Tropicimonas omnivorans TaxID=3075590 RepID=A0ABU3DDK1_9RHOB|nr:hypothetical protein [Roseicyclus sp. F158]MDT0681750.1 hypothetical protein [Roseicyclus sp. F158]